MFRRARYNNYYYSFKTFPRFWLVKTTRIIHHNQLLFTKFEKKLRHIDSMTSKVQPTANYWTVDRKKLGTRLCYFCWAEKWLRGGLEVWAKKIFRMNNKAIIEFGFRRIIMKNSADLGGCYPPRPLALVDNTLLDLQFLHILLSLIQ